MAEVFVLVVAVLFIMYGYVKQFHMKHKEEAEKFKKELGDY